MHKYFSATFLPWPRSEGSAMTIRHPFCHGHDPKDRPWPSGTLFAMAKIRSIGHDHQTPFFLLLLLEFKWWHKAKASCQMINILETPKSFTDSEPLMKWLREGVKKHSIDSVIMIIPRRTLPPSFWRTVIALGYFLCDVFWLIWWFRCILKQILGMFETNFGYERL